MSNSNESVKKTLFMVIATSLVCSVFVTGAAVGLKSKQKEQKVLDRQRNILSVSKLLAPNMSNKDILTTFKNRIEPRVLNLKIGQFDLELTQKLISQGKSYDVKAALKTPGEYVVLTPDQDKVKIRNLSKKVEIYLVKNTDGQYDQIILPYNGTGLWSMMYAFISISLDGNTIQGITYYDQGETPGLGGEVENPRWKKQFEGKKLFNENNQLAIKVVKGGADKTSPYQVDALTGASLTSRSVQRHFDFWFSDLGYEPFLNNLKNGQIKGLGAK